MAFTIPDSMDFVENKTLPWRRAINVSSLAIILPNLWRSNSKQRPTPRVDIRCAFDNDLIHRTIVILDLLVQGVRCCEHYMPFP